MSNSGSCFRSEAPCPPWPSQLSSSTPSRPCPEPSRKRFASSPRGFLRIQLRQLSTTRKSRVLGELHRDLSYLMMGKGVSVAGADREEARGRSQSRLGGNRAHTSLSAKRRAFSNEMFNALRLRFQACASDFPRHRWYSRRRLTRCWSMKWWRSARSLGLTRLLADLHPGSDPSRVPCSRLREHGVPWPSKSWTCSRRREHGTRISCALCLRFISWSRGGDQRGVLEIPESSGPAAAWCTTTRATTSTSAAG